MSGGYNKTIICLANSRKHTSHCIAGKEITGSKIGQWIRPVSGRESGELSEEDQRFKNGQHPQLLDVVNIVMRAPQQHSYQPENHLIDDGYYWRHVRTATYDEVKAADLQWIE
jgi:hypothetical protein